MHPAPRLVHLAGQVRLGLILSVLAGFLGGILIVFQARLASQVIAAAFLLGEGLAQASRPLAILFCVIVARAGLAFAAEWASRKAALKIKSSLRQALFDHILRLGPAYTRRQQTGELAAVIQEGVDGLEAYFSQYLPQLALAALVPLTILVVVFPLDFLSGLVLLITAPLIPLFMILIGRLAERQTRRQWQALARLSAHFLDALQGLVTLKILGRSLEHAAVIDRTSQRHRQATMGVLRITFLSALALELIATLSTALLAVEIALRLLSGRLDYPPALMILLLAPEFYLPLRTLGMRFHAGESGVAASRRIFAILDEPVDKPVTKPEGSPHTLAPKTDPESVDSPPSTLHSDPSGLSSSTASSAAGTRVPSWQVLRFEGIGYTYPDSAQPALSGISFELAAGQHAALAGASGAGKSTLMSLLLRFIEPGEGVIWIDNTPLPGIDPQAWRQQVAWVPQWPHLFHGTLEENLRLVRPEASLGQIREAARSAGLDAWIAALPMGYETPLTDLVSRLSTGEVQRLALARAFLRDAPLLLLDEHTAFLDPELEDELRETVDRLTRGRTSLTIAHHLETVIQADEIMVLEAGRLVQTGTHAQLLRQQGTYTRLASAGMQGSRASIQLAQAPDKTSGRAPLGSSGHRLVIQWDRLETGPTDPVSRAECENPVRTDPPIGAGGTQSVPPASRVRVPTQSVATQSVGTRKIGEIRCALRQIREPTFLRLLGFIRPYWKGTALASLVSLAAAACGVGLLGTSAYLLSSAALRPSIAALQVAIVGVRFFGLGRGVFRYLERWVSHEVNFRVLAGMRVWFYRRLEPLAPARLFDAASGDLLSRAVGDISTLEEFYLRGLSPALVAVLTTAGLWLFLQHFSLPMAHLFAAYALLAGLALPAAVRWMARRPARDEAEARAGLGAALVDSLQGLPELAACNQGEAVLNKLVRLERTYAQAQGRSARILAWQAGLSSLAIHLAGWTLLGLGIALVEGGQVPGVLLAALLMSSQAALEAVLPLPQAAHQMEKSLQSARRLFSLVDRPPEVPEERGEVNIHHRAHGERRAHHRERAENKINTAESSPKLRAPSVSAAAAPGTVCQDTAACKRSGDGGWSSVKDGKDVESNPKKNSAFSASPRCFSNPIGLKIRGLTFGYEAGLPPVFDGLDFELRPGERVGLVGPSGVGKTTLSSLLMRFWDFQAGEIELDGKPLQQLSPGEIHALVAVLPARPYLFSTTLRQNLLLANPGATPEELVRALQRACLDEWAASLPDGLDTWVGEHGQRLSAGERQRLALARLFLQDTPLMVLDEPFANLDSTTAAQAWQAVLDHTRGRTLLIITHRLHGLEVLDRIGVLRGGRIMEEGRPADLLAQHGCYRRMWDFQHRMLLS